VKIIFFWIAFMAFMLAIGVVDQLLQ